MNNVRSLTPMEKSFVQHYCAAGEPTFRNAERSAVAAGYGEPHSSAWRLLKRSKVVAMIAATMPEPSPASQVVDADSDSADDASLASWSRAELKRQYARCLTANDTANAFKFLDALTKSSGAYRDADSSDTEQTRSYSALEVAEAQAYARWRLLGCPDPAQDAPGTLISGPAGTSTLPQTGRVGAATTTLKGTSK